MELSEQALMVLVESVWAVSARRAFHEGYRVGASRYPLTESPAVDRLASTENAHNAAMVLVKDEVRRRLDAVMAALHTLHERASMDTSYGKSQWRVLRVALEMLQTADAVDPHARSTGKLSTREGKSS